MELLKGYFTVPSDVTDTRVLESGKEYIRKYVESFEKEGWKLESEIQLGKQKAQMVDDIKEGRVRWAILAYWDRKPIKQIIEVDEKHIPKLLETGRFSLV